MSYSHPCKKIVDASDLSAFRRSIAYSNIQEAIHSILVLVKSHELPRGILNLKLVSALKCEHATETYTIQCPNGQRVLNSLAYFDSVIENFPPLPGPRRFGNYAFRDWYGQLEDSAAGKLQELDILNTNKAGFLSELSYYFVAAFGSGIRLDFGTGHELSFVAFIGSLLKADALKNITGQDILVIFARYYDLVRRLILTYSLEPAGSHGVWGLDDHFHFIYILGAAQFNEPVSRYAPPVSQCLNEGTISEFLDTNLYINALAFIQKIKSGPFKNHSPLIYDIHTSVTLWKKVLSGLLKMYDVE
ncbi:Serine/threonine-protein phosphatase 2A activator 1 [Yamadazyma tenuis]|nr:Serine/threonine-protein phosphatase 2A activator 1 [Yamadazyma tenuis]